jgi:hypothetical protein
MKLRTILIAFFFALLLTPSLKAAGEKVSGALTIDPVALLFGPIYVTYEMQTDPQNSLSIHAFYDRGWWGWSGFGAGASYRWYIFDWYLEKDKKQSPLKGFSFGPRATIGYYSWSSDYSFLDTYAGYGNKLYFSIGAEAAYKWVFSGFVVEPIIRVMIPITSLGGYSGDYMGVNLGIPFN